MFLIENLHKYFLVKDHFLRIKETCHIFILSKNRQIRKYLFSDRIIKYVSTCKLKKLSLKIALKKYNSIYCNVITCFDVL